MGEYNFARRQVANLIGVDLKEITYILYKTKVDNAYESFEIPKKNGEVRVIEAPNKKLKWIQRELNKKLFKIHTEYITKNRIKPRISHGFEKNKSIITNAYRHKNKRYLLNIDISNFFQSFNFGRVQGYLYKSKEFNFSKEVATIIAQLVCYKGKLPQGAPTSPLISNLIFNIVDLKILALAKKYKLNYTRYVDDMSFSTNNKEFEKKHLDFIQELSELLKKNGFEINPHKTRLMYHSSKQDVTGLTVNDKINVSRKFIKNTRAMANRLYTTNSFQINNKEGTLEQLEGRLSFINQLDWFNNKVEYRTEKKKQKKKYICGLNVREKQYRYFLFYKYFYRPVKPTIVTEGKTDILHIKAALMKYSDRYPNLITKNIDGSYQFKIYFLKKTKRLNYFFGIVSNGADTMQNIWNFYEGKNEFENIYEYMEDKRRARNKDNAESSEKVNPVILLFDNEQTSKGKPLEKIQRCIDESKRLNDDELSKKLKANLILHTIPLVNDQKECEIEDLYKEEILNVTIDEKKFSRSNDFDSEKYFGKDTFSKYIFEHYEEIDFENFLTVLDSISSLV